MMMRKLPKKKEEESRIDLETNEIFEPVENNGNFEKRIIRKVVLNERNTEDSFTPLRMDEQCIIEDSMNDENDYISIHSMEKTKSASKTFDDGI